MSTPAFYTVTVPATGVVNLASTGRALKCKDATGPLYVQFGGSSRFPIKRGSRLEEMDPFTTLTLFNEGATDVTASFYVGDSLPEDTLDTETAPASSKVQVNGGSAGSGLLSSGNLVLDNTVGIALVGVDAAGRRRKHIVITNLSSTLSLTLRKKSTSTSNAATIFPQQAFILETDADLYLVNASGSDGLNCQVLETFYTEAADATA